MAKSDTTYCYCYANGVAKFGRKVPEAAIIIDCHTDAEREAAKLKNKQLKEEYRAMGLYWSGKQSWKASLSAKMRLAHDNKTLLVPGIPEAANQTEGLKALRKFIKWAVKI